MKFRLQLILDDADSHTQIEEVIELERNHDQGYCAGLELQEAKQVLKILQQKIILQQAKLYTQSHRHCPCCHRPRRIKGHHSVLFRTLFGTVVLPSLRVYQCKCSDSSIKTVSLLKDWLPEHISPELQYIETKWASYMSFDKTADLLSDVLPIHATHNGKSVRNHLHKTAKRQESELEGKPRFISGCANDWAKLPKPDKPITIGIDGGYVRSCVDKRSNFEVIVGKSLSQSKSSKRFGLVQSFDKEPERRLLNVLKEQGMQENQQITFLSDGADNVRNLQFIMHPEAEHVLDWFHLTMRLTVLNQFAKGLLKSDPDPGQKMQTALTRVKWYLWHGNVENALESLEECYLLLMDDEWDETESIKYENKNKFIKCLEELNTYVQNNRHMIPNYGERWRYGETIASSFVESTVNEVVTKRMVKKQQMQWSQLGAHYLLQTRTAALNGDLSDCFERWYPGLKVTSDHDRNTVSYAKAA